MSDAITLVHMSISFITSIVVAVLGYFKFKDTHPQETRHTETTKEEGESSSDKRLTILEVQRAEDKERLDRLEARLNKKK